VARRSTDTYIFCHVQAAEPSFAGEPTDRIIELLASKPQAMLATLATSTHLLTDLEDPACVKLVRSPDSLAMYFSRSVIPHRRDASGLSMAHFEQNVYLQHLGIYAYRRDFLLKLAQLPKSPLEQIEKLEQLRFLQAGYRISVGIVSHAARGIDTREDYDAFLARQKNRKS